MPNQHLKKLDVSSKKIRDKIISVNRDDVAPSPSEKVAREEINKLIKNSEEIKKIREKIEKSK